MIRKLYLFGIAMLLCGAAPALNLAGVDVASMIRAPNFTRPWPLHGSALVHRSFIPFYGLALHAPNDVGAHVDLSDGATPLQITLVWYAPELGREHVQEHFRRLFEHHCDEETLRRITPRMNKFIDLLPEARRGRQVTLFYTPDGGTQVRVEGGGHGHFAGIEFNRALLSLWLGERADQDVRNGLRTPPTS